MFAKLIGYSAFVAFLAAATTTQAGLMLDITDAGGGNTRWVLSGSTVVNHNGRENSFWGRAWDNGRIVNSFRGGNSVLSGSGTLSTTSGGTLAVDNVWTSTDLRFEIAPRLSTKILWRTGDTLSWSGDFIVGVDITTLNQGVYKTRNLLNGTVQDDYVLTVGSSFAAVPEPAAVAIWGLASLLGVVLMRRRNFAQN